MAVVDKPEERTSIHERAQRIFQYLQSVDGSIEHGGLADFGVSCSIHGKRGETLYKNSFSIKPDEIGNGGSIHGKYLVKGDAEYLLRNGPEIFRIRGFATVVGLDGEDFNFVPGGCIFGINHRFSCIEGAGEFLDKLDNFNKTVREYL